MIFQEKLLIHYVFQSHTVWFNETFQNDASILDSAIFSEMNTAFITNKRLLK